ncbi:MAG: hypothetical protein QME66_04630 [Candidatus Eisenbacteria bacterium]|nr:hypothetical protein [Candidatus Eisenbacteria bacterium]
MILSVLDRVLLIDLLSPQGKGSFIAMKTLRELRETLSFTPEEIEAMGMNEAEGRVTWNPEQATEKDMRIDKLGTTIIADRLREADAKQLLLEQHVPLYEKFVKTDSEK